MSLGSSQEVINYTPQEIHDADVKLNTLLVKSFTNTTFGALSGAALSIFFTRKVRIIGYAAGIGFGFALHQYGRDLLAQQNTQPKQ